MTLRHALYGALAGAGALYGAQAAYDYGITDHALQSVVEQVEADEGYRGEPYADTRGFATIGYGTRLPITKSEAALLLRSRMEAASKAFAAAWPPYDDQPDAVKRALVGMVYQLGVHGVLGFHDTLDALERRDYHAASKAVLDSKWAAETPHRADEASRAFDGENEDV